ncbi:DUF6051 family protein [Proteiniphilum saccharofermentans]|uniref:DUF6051 family protein n=1 Tax=Proteiniphilum saccharofermentans TaxID=1642647 RepID=UPI0028B1D934|nr:DUF6051 family protein [Proteiniphilum saccharofermentans]
MMNYNERYITLNNRFKQGMDCHIEETGINIRFFRFNSLSSDERGGTLPHTDSNILENFSFEYPVFAPSGKSRQKEAILLLHGLNERNWSKYLTWAEYLCFNTGKPVILFPIAFHINRAPMTWSNPRSLMSLLNFRKEKYIDDRTISYANVALSDRISQSPERFYLSGRQTWADLTVLFEEIKTGLHPLFKENTKIDIFAYSIGAFLSQVALMANQKGLFSDSRLFMFCGGSIFRSMFGISRSILDKPAFEKLQQYYIHIFGNEAESVWERDNAFNAFLRMISPEKFRTEREKFFTRFKERIRGIALSNDLVIPYHGILEALGRKSAESTIQLIDFPFPYTHENPFPYTSKDTTSLNNAFTNVFSRAAEFLA